MTYVHRFHSPLRYPGGKGKLASYIRAVVEENRLTDGHYAEPYAGGAGVALDLMFNEYVRHIHINDLDRSLYAFWYCVLHETEELCRLVKSCPLSPTEWRVQRSIQHHKATAPLLQLGFSTFYLNRTSRSGIIASAGMIGGNNQLGQWKIDARFNRVDLVARIRRIAEMKDRISLTNHDAVDFIAMLASILPERSLTYLDPPYYVKGQRLYANYYEAADHARTSELLEAFPHCWVVSYDYAPEILDLYRGRRCLVYDLQYSAADRYDGAEVMFFSDQLRVPTMAGRVGLAVTVEGCRG